MPEASHQGCWQEWDGEVGVDCEGCPKLRVVSGTVGEDDLIARHHPCRTFLHPLTWVLAKPNARMDCVWVVMVKEIEGLTVASQIDETSVGNLLAIPVA